VLIVLTPLFAALTDPKPENETAGKLSPALGCGPLDGSEGRTNAEKGSHRRTDHLRLAASGGGQEGRRHLPRTGVSQQAFYSWKRRYAGLGLSELRELRQLRDENRKLKTLVADLTLDKHILQEVLSKKA
jgi:ribosomal protein L15